MKQSISILTLWIRKKTIFHTKPYQTTPNHTKYVCIPSRQQPCIFPCIWVCSQPVACGDVIDPCMEYSKSFLVQAKRFLRIATPCTRDHFTPRHGVPARTRNVLLLSPLPRPNLVDWCLWSLPHVAARHHRTAVVLCSGCMSVIISHHTMHTTTCPFYGGPKAR